MIDKKRILAIIPARGGSKRLPRKNIMNLGNKPLISWTIEAALKSQYIDQVILSSDDLEICDVAKKYNCSVPFIRPSELASDTADSASVIVHATELCGKEFDILILLQPTSPFRTHQHIDEALERFHQLKALSLTSVNSLNKNPQWFFRVNNENHEMLPLLDSNNGPHIEIIQQVHLLNGAIYIVDKNNFLATKTFIDSHTKAYIMDTYSSLDIDTREDFNQAQFILDHHLVEV